MWSYYIETVVFEFFAIRFTYWTSGKDNKAQLQHKRLQRRSVIGESVSIDMTRAQDASCKLAFQVWRFLKWGALSKIPRYLALVDSLAKVWDLDLFEVWPLCWCICRAGCIPNWPGAVVSTFAWSDCHCYCRRCVLPTLQLETPMDSHDAAQNAAWLPPKCHEMLHRLMWKPRASQSYFHSPSIQRLTSERPH